MKKDVALVLSSGGPRGWAYIGAIEELVGRGYNITSVAGTSIGSLVGGIYAAGKLEDVKEWLFTLDAWKVFSLMDLSLSMNHIVKGDKVIGALKEIVPDVNIEDLNIPYRAVAADLYTGEEVVFDRGPLFDAIRASISIPSLFRPVKEGDILVAFDVNDIDVDTIRDTIIREATEMEDKEEEKREIAIETKSVLKSIRANQSLTFMEKLKLAGEQGQKYLASRFSDEEEVQSDLAFEDNYYSILSRTFSIMNHVISKNAAQRYRPDVLVKMPFDAYDEIADYARAREIAEAGRELMKTALDKYEQNI